jgi:hypothetical protein
MFAYLGLASHPAQVQSLSADRAVLVSAFAYPPGSRMVVELVNGARTFKCILGLRVDRVQPHADGGDILEGTFSRPLTADELRNLA